MNMRRKSLLAQILWTIFVVSLTFFILQKINADDPPPPNVVVPFNLINNQSLLVSYQANVFFTTGTLPNSSVLWKETDLLGNETGRIWARVADSSQIWDIVPTRDGTFDFEAALPVLYANNPGFTSELVNTFRNSNPNFKMFNPLLVYGQDKNMNGTLDPEEEGEWYLNEAPVPDNCLPHESFLNATTIIILHLGNNGDYGSVNVPPVLNYPLWFHN